MNKSTAIFCALLLVSINVSAARPGRSTVIGEVSKIIVTINGQGPATDDCASFRVSPAQVASFLSRAILITGAQQHDWFALGSCHARGTLATRYGAWHWELRSLGTATITSTSGETFILGDPKQESSLGEDGN